MISLKNVSKKFGDFKAIDVLSLEVPENQILGLLGPNGAGKTTTMRILTGFLLPEDGEVVVNGVDVLKDPVEARKVIGYLPENNPLYKDMLVKDFLLFSANLKNVLADQLAEALDFVVNAVGIKEVYFKPIGILSKGYKQRVGIAAALLHKPKVLILDEPTEGLDPNQRKEIRNLIKDLAKDRTIIISTHVMQEVENLCDRLVLINKGKKIFDDSVKNAQKAAKFYLTLQGENIVEELKKLAGVHLDSFLSLESKKLSLVVSVDKNIVLQPLLADLIIKNRWVMWQLQEEKISLEDLFSKLTVEKI